MSYARTALLWPPLLAAALIAGSGTWDKALQGGLYPFVVGDLMKLFLASVTLPAAWSLVARFRGTN